MASSHFALTTLWTIMAVNETSNMIEIELVMRFYCPQTLFPTIDSFMS